MKKVILVVLFVFTTVIINAQEKDAFTVETEKLIELITKPALQPTIDQFAGMVAEDKKADFLKELDGTLPELYSAMAKIYMEEFTQDEIKELLAFYDTKIGKKMTSKQGVLMQKGMIAGQSWGMKVQALLGKYQK